jgi:hypothetical protein
MTPRDLFDALLFVVLGAALAVGSGAVSLSTDLLGAVVDALLGQSVAVYLLAGGVLGIVFVGYIAVYLPWKQSESARVAER